MTGDGGRAGVAGGAGVGPPGALARWVDPSPAVAEVAARARAQGWAVYLLDTDEADGAQGFLEACGTAFGLPPWFGLNWDALDECLADLPVAGRPGVLVVWTGWQELRQAAPDVVATALDVLRTAARGWLGRGCPAVVAVAGAGPALGLPVAPADLP